MNEIITVTQATNLTWTVAEQETAIAESANHHASAAAFDLYHREKSDRTLSIHRDGLATFAKYLAATGITRTPNQLQSDPDAWRFATFGIVEGFREWMLQAGYAISTINLRMSSVKIYVKLSAKAGTVTQQDYAMIRMVSGIGRKGGKRIDEKRPTTRISSEKSHATEICLDVARQLKTHPDTPQGRRDSVLMHLLIDHGLRAGEVALLHVGDISLATGKMKFYRPKVDVWTTHNLTPGTLAAVRAYVDAGDAPTDAGDPLIRGSRKGGKLSAPGVTRTNLTMRVKTLGKRIGVDGLSAHDCRHYWATDAAMNGTDPFVLRDSGGWSSLAMVDHYTQMAAVANEGIKQSA